MAELQQKAISRARAAFKSGKTLPLSFRLSQLQNVSRMIEECTEDLMKALHSDLRKSKQEGLIFEIETLKNDVKFFIRNLEKFAKDEKLPINLMTFEDRGIVKRDPFGVVLVLGAWNYPLLLTLQPVIGALAAGNCVIIKPSEIASHTSAVIAKLIPKYLDRECYHVIEADLEQTKLLLTNHFDYIFATGSVGMGKGVMAAAAPHLTPVTLELGGKSPCYIDENSDIELSAKRILWGKWTNLGQTCIAPDYILCSKKVEKEFLNATAKIMSEWYGQKPQESPDLPRIINDRNFLRLKSILDRTKGNIVIGGESDRKDLWITPTILTDVTPEDSVMEDEIFGPILPILTVNTPDEAIKFIVSRPKPLALYLFTQDENLTKKFLDRTSSGGVCINDTIWQVATEGLPFGGVGNSGMGRYHGKYSFDTFSHQKAVLYRGFNKIAENMGSARYPPYSDKKIGFFRPIMRNLHRFELSGYGAALTHILAILVGVALVFLLQFLF